MICVTIFPRHRIKVLHSKNSISRTISIFLSVYIKNIGALRAALKVLESTIRKSGKLFAVFINI